MKIQIVICLLLSSLIASCQVQWDKASDWTLYGYQGSQMFKIPLDSLNSFDTLKLSLDTVKLYLNTTRVLGSQNQGVWLGGYITTCKLDGNVRKVDFSNYGNFFYDEKSKTYFQLSGSNPEAWNEYLQSSLQALAKKKMVVTH